MIDKELVRDRISQLKHLQRPYTEAILYSIPCLTFIATAMFMLYIFSLENSNLNDMIKTLDMYFYLYLILILLFFGLALIARRDKFYGDKIKKNYKLLLKEGNIKSQ